MLASVDALCQLTAEFLALVLSGHTLPAFVATLMALSEQMGHLPHGITVQSRILSGYDSFCAAVQASLLPQWAFACPPLLATKVTELVPANATCNREYMSVCLSQKTRSRSANLRDIIAPCIELYEVFAVRATLSTLTQC